jgi:hypothetical protein
MLRINETPGPGWGKPIALLMLCAFGIAAGWLLWRSHRPQGISAQPMVDWSKSNSVASSLPEPSLQKMQAELEAARKRAEAVRPFIAEASKADKERLESLMATYSTALKAVRHPPVLDLTSVTDAEQLGQKKQIVQTFLKANEALRLHLTQRETAYRETLVKIGVPDESLNSVMEAYRRMAAKPTALAIKMRNDDKRMGDALLAMLEVLENNWGKWKFDSAKQKVNFEDRPARDKFLDLKEELDNASLEQMACQVKLAALDTTE